MTMSTLGPTNADEYLSKSVEERRQLLKELVGRAWRQVISNAIVAELERKHAA